MDFRDGLERDLREVFLNCGEFAHQMELWYGGECFTVPAVLDDCADAPRAPGTRSDHAEGLRSVGLTLYVSLADLPVRPKAQHGLYIGQDGYLVVSVKEEDGVMEIRLTGLDE